jgi:putative flippase GtrA
LKSERRIIAGEGLRFAIVGMLCFVIAAQITVILIRLGLGPYFGGAIAFSCAITASWYLNRSFTFRGRRSPRPLRELFGFVMANLPGAALNYSVYAGLVVFHVVEPVAAIAAGSIAGMICNFILSRWLVFRATKPARVR